MISPRFIPLFTPASTPLATHTPITPGGVNTPDGAPTPFRGICAADGALRLVPMPGFLTGRRDRCGGFAFALCGSEVSR